jgi:DNA-binding MarR family transcriptional regulator
MNPVILNYFTMKQFPTTADIGCDEHGRLYDRRLREYLVASFGEEKARRIEPLATLRWLGKEVHSHTQPLADRFKLTEGRIQVLMRLKFQGDTPLGELAEHLHVSARNVTGLVDHLERDGLVERVPDPNDRRSVRAHLTEHGVEVVEQMWREMMEATVEMTRDVPQDDLDNFRHTCLRIIQFVQEHRREKSTTRSSR